MHTAPSHDDGPQTVVLTAAAVVDASGSAHAPGALVIQADRSNGLWCARGIDPTTPQGPGALTSDDWSNLRVLAIDTPEQVLSRPEFQKLRRLDFPTAVLIPGLVNAHTHLDLTHIGPRTIDRNQGFVGFAQIVVPNRKRDELGVRGSVRAGIDKSIRGGCVAVGDIAGFMPPTPNRWGLEEMRSSPLMGVSFLEFFAMAKGQAEALEGKFAPLLGEAGEASESPGLGARVRAGLSPHAPYSVGGPGYDWAMGKAMALGIPISTHLAESVDERRAVVGGEGPMIEFLRSLNLYDELAKSWLGHGVRTSVSRLSGQLAKRYRGLSVVHLNDVREGDLEILKDSGATVIYCPRSSRSFGAALDFGPHRYREMLAMGIPVALGTDSIINLDRLAEGERGRISVVDEMSLLLNEIDEAGPEDAVAVLRMGTEFGARALGLDERLFRFMPEGETAGVVAVEIGEVVTGEKTDPRRLLLRGLRTPVSARILAMGGAKFAIRR